MIRKYIENTEEVRQRLIRMLMDDASDMCRYQRALNKQRGDVSNG